MPQFLRPQRQQMKAMQHRCLQGTPSYLLRRREGARQQQLTKTGQQQSAQAVLSRLPRRLGARQVEDIHA